MVITNNHNYIREEVVFNKYLTIIY